MKKCLALLGVSVMFFFVACSSDEDIDEFKSLSDSDAEKAVDSIIQDSVGKTDRSTEKMTSAAVSDNASDGDGISAQLRDLVLQGRYSEAIKLAGQPQSHRARYYTGIAYYGQMLQRGKFSGSERADFRDKAIEYLKQVGYESTDDNLSARALLWYGMAVHLNYTSLQKKRIALGAFHRITSTKLKETDVADDAVYYAGQVYKQMGWYSQSRTHFKKMANMKSSDRKVYDPWRGDYVGIQDASSYGLEQVRVICMAGSSGGETTKAKKEKPAEETTTEEVKAEEVKAEEVKAEEVKAEEVKAEEVKAEEVKAEETTTEDSLEDSGSSSTTTEKKEESLDDKDEEDSLE